MTIKKQMREDTKNPLLHAKYAKTEVCGYIRFILTGKTP